MFHVAELFKPITVKYCNDTTIMPDMLKGWLSNVIIYSNLCQVIHLKCFIYLLLPKGISVAIWSSGDLENLSSSIINHRTTKRQKQT